MPVVAQRPLFDTHACIKRLVAAGIPEVHAEAFVEVQAIGLAEQGARQQESTAQALDAADSRAELAVLQLRGDLHATEMRLQGELQELKGDLHATEKQLKGELQELKGDLHATEKQLKGELQELKGDLHATEMRLQGELQELKGDLRATELNLKGEIVLLREEMKAQENRLIIKLSAIMAALMGFFGLAMKLVDKLL